MKGEKMKLPFHLSLLIVTVLRLLQSVLDNTYFI